MEPCGLIHAGQVPLWELVFREFPCGYALSQLQETTMSDERGAPGAGDNPTPLG